MRRTSILAALTIVILLALALTACAPSIKVLSAAELDAVNRAFQPFQETADGAPRINRATYFFTSWYDHPANLDLAEFLRYFPRDGEVTDEEELRALSLLPGWPFGETASLEALPVPIGKISAASLEATLVEYAGIGQADLTGRGANKVLYLPDYDAYYSYASDFAGGVFVCTHGESDGNTLRLYGEHQLLTLQFENGRYLIRSFLPIK